MSKKNSIYLPRGYALTLTTDAVSSGTYARIANPGDNTTYGTTAISASSTVELGPFDENRYYLLVATNGEISYSSAFESVYDEDALDNVTITGGTINDVSTLTSYADNSTSRRLKGLDFSGTAVQGYEGIFYNASYDTWGTLKTRLSYGSNADMDMILQASNDLLFLCTNDGSGSEGKVKFMVDTDQAIEYHFSDDLTPAKVGNWDQNGLNLASGKHLYNSVEAGITASATQTQGQQPLTSAINQVSTVGTIGDVVTLPAAEAGKRVLVINDGANSMDIYPASGDNLGAGVDTALSLASGGRQWFTAYDATNWVQA